MLRDAPRSDIAAWIEKVVRWLAPAFTTDAPQRPRPRGLARAARLVRRRRQAARSAEDVAAREQQGRPADRRIRAGHRARAVARRAASRRAGLPVADTGGASPLACLRPQQPASAASAEPQAAFRVFVRDAVSLHVYPVITQ